MNGLIPVVGERSAYQTACQNCCCEVNEVDDENHIACDPKRFCAEDPNVQEDDGCAYEGDCSDPEKLSYKCEADRNTIDFVLHGYSRRISCDTCREKPPVDIRWSTDQEHEASST